MVSSGVKVQRWVVSRMTISTTILQTAVITLDTLWHVQQTEEAHAHNVKMSKQKKIQFNSYVYMPHSLADLETFHLQSAATTVARPINAYRCSSHTTLCQEIVTIWHFKYSMTSIHSYVRTCAASLTDTGKCFIWQLKAWVTLTDFIDAHWFVTS